MVYKPLVWFLRGCGIAPSSTPADKYYTILALAVSVLATVIEVCYFPSIDDPMEEVIFKFLSAIISFTPIVFIMNNICFKGSYKSLLLANESVAPELGAFSLVRTEKVILLTFLTEIVMFSIAHILISDNLFLSLSHVTIYMLYLAPLMQFMVLAFSLKVKFSALNARLSLLTADSKNVPVQTTISQLDDVFRVHSALHVIVSDVNSHFCMYNLFSFTGKITYLVLQIYHYLTSIIKHYDDFNFVACTFCALEVLSFLAQVLVCHACAREANRTVLLAHRCLQPDSDPQLWDQVGQFSALAINNKVHFSVAGVFSLNRALITKAAISVLSYLIIAVQLKDVRPIGEAENTFITTYESYNNSY